MQLQPEGIVHLDLLRGRYTPDKELSGAAPQPREHWRTRDALAGGLVAPEALLVEFGDLWEKEMISVTIAL